MDIPKIDYQWIVNAFKYQDQLIKWGGNLLGVLTQMF